MLGERAQIERGKALALADDLVNAIEAEVQVQIGESVGSGCATHKSAFGNRSIRQLVRDHLQFVPFWTPNEGYAVWFADFLAQIEESKGTAEDLIAQLCRESPTGALGHEESPDKI
jgi:hypothetical protein